MKHPPIADLSKIPTADLHARLSQALSRSAAALYEGATIWAELDRRGEALRLHGLAQFLPRIHRGELAAETVLAFAGQMYVIKSLAGMPLDQQRKLADGETVSVAGFDAGGKTITEEKPLSRLTEREAKLVIESGQVRPVSAQINSLKRSRAQVTTRPFASRSTVTVSADHSAGMLVIGSARLLPTDLRDALALLGYRLERVDPKRKTMAVAQAEARV